MADEKMKTVAFTEDGIGCLPKNKSVVYKIKDKNGQNLYTGTAKRGRVCSRLKEHLPGGPDPIQGGISIQIQQKKTLNSARKLEAKIIANDKPKYNNKGK